MDNILDREGERNKMKKFFFMIVSAIFMLFLVYPIHTQAAVADGTYSLNYQVNKPGSSSASMANDYFLKPAQLVVNNGKMTVQLTINKSAWVTEFNPPGGATVISSNSAADQRVVQFNISSFKQTVAMKIDIDDIDYHHSYSVDFVFDGSGLPEAPQNVTTPPSNTTNNSSSSGSNTSSNKQPSQNNEVATNNTSSNEQSTPTDSEVNASQNTSQNEVTNENEQDVESSEEVENPETSDALPIMYIVAFMVAAIVFIRTKQTKTN